MTDRPAARVVAVIGLCVLVFAGCRTARNVPPAAAPGPPDVVALAHPSDAVAFGGHWYKVFIEDGAWPAKRTRCEAMGGYLACIESEAEQAFIARLANGRYLSLGAYDAHEEGEWQWINGAPFDYTCWLKGQPNNWDGEEHFLATYTDGDWVDVAAEGDDFWMPIGFICEWDH